VIKSCNQWKFNNPKEKPRECRTVILRNAEKETLDYTQRKNKISLSKRQQ